jgi:uncharacterized protein (DUF58 family)
MRLLPTRLALWIAALWVGVCVLSATGALPESAWRYTAAALAAVAVVDGTRVLRRRLPEAKRDAPHVLASRRWHDVGIVVTNATPRPVRVELYDHHPGSFEATDLPVSLDVPAGGWARTRYRTRSATRGAFAFGPIQARITSSFGLFQREVRLGEPQDVRVYPDFGALSGYALMATDNRLSQIGVLQRRRRGEGMDFHQLREYRLGDSLRRIDWKATSRMHRLISREYQDERDQTILLVLDCGRRMVAADDETTHFDAALDAALLLAHVGVHHGDAVGAITMAAGERRFMAPRKGHKSVATLLEMLYDLHPGMRTPDYYEAAVDIMHRIRKRALVVFLSNLRDEDDDTLQPALALLRRRHLVLFANLREQVLSRTLRTPVADLDAALTHAATADYLQTRRASFSRLERAGALMLDAEPQQLPMLLVNRYLETKRSGLL